MSGPRSKSSKRSKPFLPQKPTGQFTERVRAVGPERFGILAIDGAKHRSHYFLADYYGKVLLEPATLSHTRGDLQEAVTRLRQAMRDFQLGDVVVAIERTGVYHRPVQHAFRQAGFDARLVHPYTAKQYRQPADPGNKTDDTDVAAIFRAACHGFGLVEPVWPELYSHLQLLRRHRRDLVQKNAALKCQILELLHAMLPGYADCFSHIWDIPTGLSLARRFPSPQDVRQAGLDGLQEAIQQAGLRCLRPTLHKILAWADQAPAGQTLAPQRQAILCDLDDERTRKNQLILHAERSCAHLVAATPYVLLMAIPGVNIVTIADLAGELGPISLYLNANAITGRAGLVPTRYQSDQVDRPNGPLRRRGHRRLRAILMQTADNLVQHNDYFRARADLWKRAGKDPRWIRVKIAKIFSRLAFALVSGQRLFAHPCLQQRHFILGKLLKFHAEHQTDLPQTQKDLEAAIEQLPAKTRGEEAQPLREQLDELAKRRRGPQPLADLIPLVLARLGVRVQSEQLEGAGP